MKDIDEDRTAILAVLEAETAAYLRRDYEAWQVCWHDGPEIRRVHTHVGSGVTVVSGQDVRDQMRRMMSGSENWQTPAAIERRNYNIVISAEMAWVSYDQIGDNAGTLQELSGQHHELKILHKVDGAWKIACIAGTELRTDHSRSPMIEVDAQARILWMNEVAKGRLEDHPLLTKRNGHLRAVGDAAQAEILDALSWLSQIRDRHTICVGMDAVTRAIALGQDDTGLARICWAVLRDARVFVTFDDTDRLEQQLTSAAEVYGLSKSQERLARALCDGCDISSAARALGISPNTAKTHLQRMYDKTGVRSQPALVRLLLTAN